MDDAEVLIGLSWKVQSDRPGRHMEVSDPGPSMHICVLCDTWLFHVCVLTVCVCVQLC